VGQIDETADEPRLVASRGPYRAAA